MQDNLEIQIVRKKPGRESFVKLFRFKENSDRAISLINEGYSFRFIGIIMNCDRTSVMDFYRRKKKEGIVFKYSGQKVPDGKTPPSPIGIIVSKSPVKVIRENNNSEKLNPGLSYKEYLEKDNKKNKAIREANLLRAQKLIKTLKEKRKKEGVLDILYNYN